jgi:hypothetical protein
VRVLAAIEVQVGHLVLPAQPNNGPSERKRVSGLEVHATAVEREIRDDELSALNLDEDSVADLLPEVLSVNTYSIKATVSFDRLTDPFFENHNEFWAERHRDESDSQHASGDWLDRLPSFPGQHPLLL